MNYFHFFIYTLFTLISLYASFLNFKSFSLYIQKKWNILLLWNFEFYIIRLVNKFFNYMFLGNILATELQKAREELIHQLMNLLIWIFLITTLNIKEAICWVFVFTPFIYESVRIKIIKERIYLFNNFKMEQKQRIKLLSYVIFTLLECLFILKIIYSLFYYLKNAVKVILLFEPLIICINCIFLIIISSYHYFNSKIFYEKPTYFYFLLSLNNIICNLIQMLEYIYMWFFYGSFLNFIDLFLLLKLKNCLICLKNNYKSTKNCFINEKLFNNYFKNEDKKYLKLNNIICIICRDYNYHINYKKLSCGHCFHISCLYLLFESDKSFLCPVCRREIKYELEDFEKNDDNLNSNSLNSNIDNENENKEDNNNENNSHNEILFLNRQNTLENPNDYYNYNSDNQENHEPIDINRTNKSDNNYTESCNKALCNLNNYQLRSHGNKKNLNNKYHNSIIKYGKILVNNIYLDGFNEIYEHYKINKIKNKYSSTDYKYISKIYKNYNKHKKMLFNNKIYSKYLNNYNYAHNNFLLTQQSYDMNNGNFSLITKNDTSILLSETKNITSNSFSKNNFINDKKYENTIKNDTSLLKEVNVSFNNIIKTKNAHLFMNVKRCYNLKHAYSHSGIENKISNIKKYYFKKWLTISDNIKRKNLFSCKEHIIKNKKCKLDNIYEIQDCEKNNNNHLEKKNCNPIEQNINSSCAQEEKSQELKEYEKINKIKFNKKFNLFKRLKSKDTIYVNPINTKKKHSKLNVFDFFKNFKEKVLKRNETNINDTNKKNKIFPSKEKAA